MIKINKIAYGVALLQLIVVGLAYLFTGDLIVLIYSPVILMWAMAGILLTERKPKVKKVIRWNQM